MSTSPVRIIAVFMLGMMLSGPLLAEALTQSLAVERDLNAGAAQSQQRIDALDDQSRTMLAEYQQLQQRIELQAADNRRLQARVDGQHRRIAALQSDLNEVQRIRRELPGLNRQMLGVLAEFIAADLPFLQQERGQRLQQLQQAQTNAELSEAEIFRRLLEAWDIELEYGRTLEAWRGEISLQDETRSVDLFRLGRAGLYYLTLDHAQGGVWSAAQRRWQPLSVASTAQLRAALDVAAERSAPRFLVLPLAAPQSADSDPAGRL